MGEVSNFLSEVGTGVGDLVTGGAFSSGDRAREEQRKAQAEANKFLGEEDQFIKGIRGIAGTQADTLRNAPSVAQMATMQGLDQATRQGIAQSQSQRGMSPSLAAAIAARGQAMMGVDLAARGAVAQTEEELQRQQQAFAAQMMAEDMSKQLIGARRGQALQQYATAAQQEQAAGQRVGNLMSSLGSAAMAGGMSAGSGAAAGSGAGGAAASGGGYSLGGNYTFNKGGLIPGKSIKEQDTVENDIVPTLLSPGELVIPKSVVKKGPKAIKDFATAILAQKGGNYDDLA